MKRIITPLLIAISLLLSQVALSQIISVSGTVISGDDDLTLPGVTIQIKGQPGVGTISDIDGKYNIQVDSKGTLVFSYIGFETLEVPVKGRSTIDIVLAVDSKVLGEVVVTALGIKRQKRELGYSTDEIDGDLIAQSGSDNVISALSGRSAGIQIVNPTGVDGSSSRILIRGNNSITGSNQPLIVVDGVPMSNEGGISSWEGGRDWGTALNNINQEDIEDINILKGPAAAALYGSRGGNGVVLITTKKGKKQSGLGVNYSMSYRITTPYLYREVQNKYGAGCPASFNKPVLQKNNDGVYIYPGIYNTDDGPEGEPTNTTFGYYGSAVSWGPEMDGTEILWWDGVMRKYSPQPDNISRLFKNGGSLTNNISISNAGGFGSVRVSLTDQRSDAIIDNTNLRQTTVNVGTSLNVSKKIKSDISFTYLDYTRLNSPEIGESYSNFSKGLLYGWPRSWKGLEYEKYENPDGSMFDWGNYAYSTYFPYMYSSTFWSFYNNNTTLNRKKVFGSIRLSYDINDWLKATGKIGVDFSLDEMETRNKPTMSDGITGGAYSNSLTRNYTMNSDFLITAYKNNLFGLKLNASLSAGAEMLYVNNYNINGRSGTWVYPNLYTFYNYTHTHQVPGEWRYEKQVNSTYMFFNLGYDDFLFLDVTGRNDWSSTLPSNNNSYFYPSVTLSFIPTEAFEEINWYPITFFKLRGAFAMTASDDEPYKLDFTYSTGNFAGASSASLPWLVPPLALKPQRQKSWEVGTNIELINKLDFDFTYYYIYAWDQIFDSPLTNSSGAASVRTNSGVVTNRGLEGVLNYKIIERADLWLKSGINFARNRNKIDDLGGANIYILTSLWGNNGPAIAVTEGDYYGTIYGWDYVYSYVDDNGETVGPFYDANGKALPLLNDKGTEYLKTDSRVAVGNSAPFITGGVNFALGWNNFTISGLIDTKIGGDIYCGSYVIAMQTGQSLETLYERDGNGLPYYDENGNFIGNYGVILEGAHKDGTINDKVVHYYYKYLPNMGGWGNYLTKPGIIENTWVKMRELSIVYKVPYKFIKKQNVFQDLQLSIVGRDLFYFYKTLPDNINPEGTIGTGNAQGLEYASYPGTRSFIFSIKASF